MFTGDDEVRDIKCVDLVAPKKDHQKDKLFHFGQSG